MNQTYSGKYSITIIHLGPVVCKQATDCLEDVQTDWGRRMARKAKEIFR